MPAWTTAALLMGLAVSPTPASPDQGTLRLWVSDAHGQPIHDLRADEVVLREDKLTRPVVGLELETRPLIVALIVDSSAVLYPSFRSQVIPAVVGFLGRLPAGARFCVWTSGERALRLVDLSTNVKAVETALGRLSQTGGNRLFETIDEALGDLADAQGARAALVILTALGPEFSVRDEPRAFEERERRAGVVIHAVQVAEPPLVFQGPNADEGHSPFRRRANYERALGRLTDETGGRYERVLSTLGIGDALTLVNGDLAGEYLLTYSRAAGGRTTKVDVKVSRPKVKVRHAPPLAAR